MTTVTERRVKKTNQNYVIASTASAPNTATAPNQADKQQPDEHVSKGASAAGNDNRATYLNSDIGLKPTSISAQITGILKGGKLWKHEQQQVRTIYLCFC